jgi:excisionase family DNA binding protein
LETLGWPVVTVSGPGGVKVISGPEAAVLGRHVGAAIDALYTRRRRAAPHVMLEFAIAVHVAAGGSAGSGSALLSRSGTRAVPRNTGDDAGAGVSGQPAETLSTQEAAEALEISESYVRRLVRRGILEVRDSQGPGYEILADSVAAWQERRSRKETRPEAA